jgi:site-specific recombinase XerD
VNIGLKQLESNWGEFAEHLLLKEKSPATVNKYVRDIKKFIRFLREKNRGDFAKQDVLDYKDSLIGRYKMATVNSYIISLNLYLSFLGLSALRVKTLAVQRKTSLNSVLTEDEYAALIKTAKETGKERLYLLIRTLASSGMRIGELHNVTQAMLKTGSTFIRSKNKVRELILPNYICQELLAYCEKEKIENLVFHGRRPDKPIDKAQVWRELKALARLSSVPEHKVFPHNFRHFFAKKFLSAYEDIMDLADILGHSSIETTRIYTRTSGQEKRDRINKLDL